jgi:hypothetical protein
MPLPDKVIVCTDCGAEFLHTAAEQTRFVDRGFVDEPKRCSRCRRRRRRRRGRVSRWRKVPVQ